jgi:hypothetical protein
MTRLASAAALLALAALALLGGCGELDPAPAPPAGPTGVTAPAGPGVTEPADDPAVVRARAVLDALAADDPAALAALADPGRGVTFAPYARVEDSALTFSPAELAALMASDEPHLWGAWDGSGAPLELTWAEYRARFVFDRDFRDAPVVAVDRRVTGGGGTISNYPEFFGPDATFVEFAWPQTDSDPLDWSALRVFLDADGDLIGLVHDQWTI